MKKKRKFLMKLKLYLLNKWKKKYEPLIFLLLSKWIAVFIKYILIIIIDVYSRTNHNRGLCLMYCGVILYSLLVCISLLSWMKFPLKETKQKTKVNQCSVSKFSPYVWHQGLDHNLQSNFCLFLKSQLHFHYSQLLLQFCNSNFKSP